MISFLFPCCFATVDLTQVVVPESKGKSNKGILYVRYEIFGLVSISALIWIASWNWINLVVRRT